MVVWRRSCKADYRQCRPFWWFRVEKGRSSPYPRCLYREMCTYRLENDREYHEHFHWHQEAIEPDVVLRANAVGHPRAMMVIHTDTSSANLAMPCKPFNRNFAIVAIIYKINIFLSIEIGPGLLIYRLNFLFLLNSLILVAFH